MVTKDTCALWPYEPRLEPQVMTDEQQEAAHASVEVGADQSTKPRAGPVRWLVYGAVGLLALLGGWHFVAAWLQGGPL